MGNGPCQSNTMSFFCLLNQSCHQSKHRDGMENRLRMTDRIWEWNTATRPPPNPGQALPISKSPSPHPNPLLGVSLWAQLDAQKGGGDPSVTQGHPGDGTGAQSLCGGCRAACAHPSFWGQAPAASSSLPPALLLR